MYLVQFVICVLEPVVLGCQALVEPDVRTMCPSRAVCRAYVQKCDPQICAVRLVCMQEGFEHRICTLRNLNVNAPQQV